MKLPIPAHLLFVVIAILTMFNISSSICMFASEDLIKMLGFKDSFSSKAIIFFVGPYIGVVIAILIAKYLVLTKCPQCQRASRITIENPLSYHCSSCGHIHKTILKTSLGKTNYSDYKK